jgi:hypothetical protein
MLSYVTYGIKENPKKTPLFQIIAINKSII